MMHLSPLKIVLCVVFSLLSGMTYADDLTWTGAGFGEIQSNTNTGYSKNWTPINSPDKADNLIINATNNTIYWNSTLINSLTVLPGFTGVMQTTVNTTVNGNVAVNAGTVDVRNAVTAAGDITVSGTGKLNNSGSGEIKANKITISQGGALTNSGTGKITTKDGIDVYGTFDLQSGTATTHSVNLLGTSSSLTVGGVLNINYAFMSELRTSMRDSANDVVNGGQVKITDTFARYTVPAKLVVLHSGALYPSVKAKYTFLTSEKGLTGKFTDLSLPALGDNLAWSLTSLQPGTFQSGGILTVVNVPDHLKSPAPIAWLSSTDLGSFVDSNGKTLWFNKAGNPAENLPNTENNAHFNVLVDKPSGKLGFSFSSSSTKLTFDSTQSLNVDPHSSRTVVIAYRVRDWSAKQIIYNEGDLDNGIRLSIEGSKLYGSFSSNGVTYTKIVDLSTLQFDINKFTDGLLLVTSLSLDAGGGWQIKTQVDPVSPPLKSDVFSTNGARLKYHAAPPSIGLDTRGFIGKLYEVLIYNSAFSTDALLKELWNKYATLPGDAPIGFSIRNNGSGFFCVPVTGITVSAVYLGGAVNTSYPDGYGSGVIVQLKLKNNNETVTKAYEAGTWGNVSTNKGTISKNTRNTGFAEYAFDKDDKGVANFSLDYRDNAKSKSITPYVIWREDQSTQDNESFSSTPIIFTDMSGQLIVGSSDSLIPDSMPHKFGGAPIYLYLSYFNDQCENLALNNITLSIKTVSPQLSNSQDYLEVSRTVPYRVDSQGRYDKGGDYTNRYQSVFTYKDVGLVHVWATADVYDAKITDSYDSNGKFILLTTQSIGKVSDITNNFVIKPSALKILDVTDVNGGSLMTSGAQAIAGSKVTVTYRGLLSDNKTEAPHFRTQTKEGSGFQILPTLASPTGGSPHAVDDLYNREKDTQKQTSCDISSLPYTCSRTFTYDEAGRINIKLWMNYYEGNSIYYITSINAVSVGTFVPYKFVVVPSSSSGYLSTAGCSFAYQGQKFKLGELAFTLEAQNLSGARTLNYDGSDWKFANSNSNKNSFALNFLDDHDFNYPKSDPKTYTFIIPSTAFSTDAGYDGRATYELLASKGTLPTTEMSYQRSAAPPDNGAREFIASITPQLTNNIRGPLGSCINRDLEGDCPTTADLSALSKVNNKTNDFSIRYGRIIVKNANGPENRPLKVPVKAQYWNETNAGGGFVTNTLDDCSTFSSETLTDQTTSLTVKDAQNKNKLIRGGLISEGRLVASPAQAVRLSNGSGTLTLTQVKPALPGQAKVVFNVPDYLEYAFHSMKDANGVLQLEDPQAIATFGVYGGRGPILFMRQIYGR